MTYYIDSHTHITKDSLEDYLKEVSENKSAGIAKAMFVATNMEEVKMFDTFKKDPYFDLAFGIYPGDIDENIEKMFLDLEEVLKSGVVDALGEIGLDYYYGKDNKEIQKEVFKRQLALADKYDLPIIIHARDALDDLYQILKDHANKRRGVLHCYSGSLEQAIEFIKLGYFISFAGVITFKNNKKGVRALKGIDKNYLLLETDAPYLTPVPYRGEVNKSANVALVYEFAASALEMDLEELKELVINNYQRFINEN